MRNERRIRRLAVPVAAIALFTSGCGEWFQSPARLPPIPDAHRPPAASERERGDLDEQPVEPNTPELGLPEDAAPPPAAELPTDEPPSVVASLPPGALPNEVAAARLIESARADIADGNFEAALDRLERAITIDATNPYAYHFLAQTHLARRDYGQALGFADRAAALGNRAGSAWLARSLCLRGEILERAGRFPEARSAYGQALDVDASNAGAHAGLQRLAR